MTRDTSRMRQVETVFLEYAGHSTFLHEMLFEQFVTWLFGELEEPVRSAVLCAAHIALPY
jgi:hypothetical protein